jgi:hypothetical protein
VRIEKALDGATMKSILGLTLVLCVAGAFAVAYWLSIRPGAGWLDAQWLFLLALPYNLASLRLTGASDFSPDAPVQVAAAFLVDAAPAYLVGALVQALLRRLIRFARLRSQA